MKKTLIKIKSKENMEYFCILGCINSTFTYINNKRERKLNHEDIKLNKCGEITDDNE